MKERKSLNAYCVEMFCLEMRLLWIAVLFWVKQVFLLDSEIPVVIELTFLD